MSVTAPRGFRAAGVAAVSPDTDIVCFMDGDGSDVPSFLPSVVTPLATGEADFVMIWRERDGQWQVTRVLSYAHRAAGNTP